MPRQFRKKWYRKKRKSSYSLSTIALALFVFGFYFVQYAYSYIQALNFKLSDPALPIFWLVLLCGLGTLMFLSGVKPKPKQEKYIDARGYVVLTATNELEYRALAKEVLGREIAKHRQTKLSTT